MLEIHPGIVNVIDTKSQKLIGHVDYQTLLGYNEDGTYFFIKDDKGYAVVTLDGQRKHLTQLEDVAPSAGAVSPDGKQVAVCYIGTSSALFGGTIADSYLEAFTIDTGDQVAKISLGTIRAIGKIQFSNDGQYLDFNTVGLAYLIGSSHNYAYIYRASDWKLQASFQDENFAPTLSPDNTLAAIFQESQIEIWNITSSKAINHISDQVSSDSTFLFTPDSQKIVVLSPQQKSLSVWNISDKTLLQRTTTDLKTLDFARIDNDGKILSTGGLQPLPWEFDIGSTANFAFSSDSKEIHSAVYSEVLSPAKFGGEHYSEAYSPQEEVCTISLQADTSCQSFFLSRDNLNPFHEVMIGTDGEFYAITGDKSTLSIQGGVNGTGKLLGKVNLNGASNPISRFPFLLVPQQSFFAFSQPQLVEENINTNKQIKFDPSISFSFTTVGSYLALDGSVSEDGSYLAALSTKDNKITVFNLATLEQGSTISPETSDTTDSQIEIALALSPDGGQLAYITTLTDKASKTVNGHKLNIVNISNGQNVLSVDLSVDNFKPAQGAPAYFLTESPDGKLLGIKSLLDLKLEQGPFFTDLKFSPDGKLLALSAMNNNIYLIDSSTGKVLNTISVPAPALRLAFSPDGTLLASAHGAGGVDLWGVTP
jgi:WD40 repeat protein